jgi:hypothetical protein
MYHKHLHMKYVSDRCSRAPIEESRKWGLYNIINLLFKTYFKLNSISLSKNILRALQAGSADIPDLKAFPKAHQVTFKYYVGVIYFLEENYVLVCEPNVHDPARFTVLIRCLGRGKSYTGLAIVQ